MQPFEPQTIAMQPFEAQTVASGKNQWGSAKQTANPDKRYAPSKHNKNTYKKNSPGHERNNLATYLCEISLTCTASPYRRSRPHNKGACVVQIQDTITICNITQSPRLVDHVYPAVVAKRRRLDEHSRSNRPWSLSWDSQTSRHPQGCRTHRRTYCQPERNKAVGRAPTVLVLNESGFTGSPE
jgi:hypothetical protein